MKQLTTNCKITENDLLSSFWYDIIIPPKKEEGR